MSEEGQEVPRDLGGRIRYVFAEGAASHDYAETYLETVHTNLHESEALARRLILALVILVVVFELLNRAVVEEVSLGPIKLNDFTVVHKLIPLAFAVVYYYWAGTMSNRILLHRVQVNLLQVLHPQIVASDLEYFLLPPQPGVVEAVYVRALRNRHRRTQQIFNIGRFLPILAILLLCSSTLWMAYAFYVCFMTFGFTDIVVWLECVFSIYLVVIGFLFFWYTDTPDLRSTIEVKS